MRRPLVRLALAAVLLALGACASMPLSTLWKLSQFGPDDLLRIEPSQLRVAAATAEGVRPDAGQTTLVVDLVARDGSKRSIELALQEASGEIAPAQKRAWTIARPTTASERRLAELRDELRANPDAEPDSVAIHVNVMIHERPAQDVRTLHLHVAIKLAAGEPWLSLFEGLPLPIDAQ